MSEHLRVVVVGGGLAGAASAWALARRGHQVTLLEREEAPAYHASGRNAGLIRHLAADPTLVALARDGAALLADPPADLAPTPLYRPTGSRIVARSPRLAARLEAEVLQARQLGVEVELVPAREADLWGVTPPSDPAAVVAVTPLDGVCDTTGLVRAYLESARRQGAELVLGRAAALQSGPAGLRGVVCDGRELPADVVVNAGGAWSAELAEAAGGLRLPLVSYRRHLFVTESTPLADPERPWVWDEDGFYLRADGEGLLVCACDTDPRPPEDAQVDPAAAEGLRRTLARLAPELEGLRLARQWAGLRGFVPDQRFVIGWDPELRGLLWATALGGHGLTTSAAVGELVAALAEGQRPPAAAQLDPARLVAARQEAAS